jgi:hypothetical protein
VADKTGFGDWPDELKLFSFKGRLGRRKLPHPILLPALTFGPLALSASAPFVEEADAIG